MERCARTSRYTIIIATVRKLFIAPPTDEFVFTSRVRQRLQTHNVILNYIYARMIYICILFRQRRAASFSEYFHKTPCGIKSCLKRIYMYRFTCYTRACFDCKITLREKHCSNTHNNIMCYNNNNN